MCLNIYSMEGSVTKLPEIVKLKEYKVYPSSSPCIPLPLSFPLTLASLSHNYTATDFVATVNYTLCIIHDNYFDKNIKSLKLAAAKCQSTFVHLCHFVNVHVHFSYLYFVIVYQSIIDGTTHCSMVDVLHIQGTDCVTCMCCQ